MNSLFWPKRGNKEAVNILLVTDVAIFLRLQSVTVRFESSAARNHSLVKVFMGVRRSQCCILLKLKTKILVLLQSAGCQILVGSVLLDLSEQKRFADGYMEECLCRSKRLIPL